MVLEVAVRAALVGSSRSSFETLAVLLAVMIPQTKRLLPGLWADLIGVVKSHLDFERQEMVIKAIAWAIGDSLTERIGLAGEVLVTGQFFADLAAQHPESVVIGQITHWIQRQTTKALGEKEKMTLAELRTWLAVPGHLEEMGDVEKEPPQVAFDFGAQVDRYSCLLAQDHFMRTTGIALRHEYSE
jgi:hypothetical protein